jgi:hypothetical protein
MALLMREVSSLCVVSENHPQRDIESPPRTARRRFNEDEQATVQQRPEERQEFVHELLAPHHLERQFTPDLEGSLAR